MPIYEYTCDACETDFEKIVRVGAPVPACPSCGSDEVHKKLSLSSFRLKGGGWYADAYAGASNKQAGGSSSKPSTTATPSKPSSSSKSSATGKGASAS